MKVIGLLGLGRFRHHQVWEVVKWWIVWARAGNSSQKDRIVCGIDGEIRDVPTKALDLCRQRLYITIMQ